MCEITKSVADKMMAQANTQIRAAIERFGLLTIFADNQSSATVLINLSKSLGEWLVSIFQQTWPGGNPEGEAALRRDLAEYLFQHSYLSGVADSPEVFMAALASKLFDDAADMERMNEFLKMDFRSATQEIFSRCQASEHSSPVMLKMAEAVEQQRAKAMVTGLTEESRINMVVEYMAPLLCLAAIRMPRPDPPK